MSPVTLRKLIVLKNYSLDHYPMQKFLIFNCYSHERVSWGDLIRESKLFVVEYLVCILVYSDPKLFCFLHMYMLSGVEIKSSCASFFPDSNKSVFVSIEIGCLKC